MKEDEEVFTIQKRHIYYISIAIIFFVGGFLANFLMSAPTSPKAGSVTVAPAPPTPATPPEATRVNVSVDDDPSIGPEDAPVTIIEFSDFQCPFCRKFWTETLPLIKSEYIDTGKVKFVYRDFPIPSLGHSAAFPSAEAAECVREQGGDEAFWKIHDKIFEEQNIIDSGNPEGPVKGTVQFGVSDIKQWVQEIGYNVDECLDSGKFRSEVQKDLDNGQAVGVTGTPTFFVNGKKIVGALPFSAFKEIIDAELEK